MRLIDADKAKAELLRIAGDIHGWGEFFDGIRSGYQSAADRLDTIPTVEERDKGYWIDINLDTSICSVCRNPQEDEEKFCPNILLGLLTGFYGIKNKPWQPEIGDVYFYVAVDEGKNKGVIHSETLFNKNDIKFLL